MEKIHQGIGFTSKVPLPESVAAQLAEQEALYIVLRSPSTQQTAIADGAVIGYAVNREQTELTPNQITISLDPATTGNMRIGAQVLEIYASDKSKMFFYKPDFAFVLKSSAAGASGTTPVDTDEEVPEGDSDLTYQDIDNFLNTLN